MMKFILLFVQFSLVFGRLRMCYYCNDGPRKMFLSCEDPAQVICDTDDQSCVKITSNSFVQKGCLRTRNVPNREETDCQTMLNGDFICFCNKDFCNYGTRQTNTWTLILLTGFSIFITYMLQ